jgi:hypothetical protein
MTATCTTARIYACPDGHAGQADDPLRMIVPDGLDLAPACPACRQPMTPAGRPLEGAWRVDECCTPARPDGSWAGPPRDPAACASCFGTQRRAICLACYITNCDGDHGDQCLACDATGTESCPACQGEGRLYDLSGEDAGPCPAVCEGGRVPCRACAGTRKAPGGRR